ncbi:MAG: ATP-dependent DNA ligase [Patescibacteria group bacterium]
MKFSELSRYLEKLEKTASRNEMTQILAEVLKRAGSDEVGKICYLLLGELLPAYRGVEFNIAEKLMVEILAKAYGARPEAVGRSYQARGDLGDVAYDLAFTHRPRRPGGPSVRAVYDRMLEIAEVSGTGSQDRKIQRFAGLLGELDSRSAKYVARIPVGKLRLGFSDATILDALSVFSSGDKFARKRIEAAYNVIADIGAIAMRVKASGLAGLSRLHAEPGVPIRPSLAERLRTAEEVVKKAGPEVGIEPKLDGFRTQIHVWRAGDGKRVTLFSRNLENTTAMFPEIVVAARRLPVTNAILDGEAIGYNPKTGTFAAFQETAQRKRKYDIEEFAKKIPLSVFVFDLLFLNGESLLVKPFSERRQRLERLFSRTQGGGTIRLAESLTTGDPAVIERELRENVDKGLEGVVVKKLDAPYEAGSRGFHWIKLKATTAALERLRAGEGKHDPKMLDTVDCVVMAAYKGRGKRTAFGVGGFLLGVRGRDERYYSISRLGTGLSDEQFREARERVKKLAVAAEPKEYDVEKNMAPDIWVRPSLVVEILADEISLSERHTAGKPSRTGRAPVRGRKEEWRGYSLRFPRLVRFRDDKNPEDATTVAEIAKMYTAQKP